MILGGCAIRRSHSPFVLALAAFTARSSLAKGRDKKAIHARLTMADAAALTTAPHFTVSLSAVSIPDSLNANGGGGGGGEELFG